MLVFENDRTEFWVFLVFRHVMIGLTDTGAEFTQPEFQGLFTTPDAAEAACTWPSDTVFPVRVNHEVPRETHTNPLCWWPRNQVGGSERPKKFREGT